MGSFHPKSHKFKMLMKEYSATLTKESNYTIQWHNDCKDGKASGLGTILLASGSVNRYELGLARNSYQNTMIKLVYYLQLFAIYPTISSLFLLSLLFLVSTI